MYLCKFEVEEQIDDAPAVLLVPSVPEFNYYPLKIKRKVITS
jgi:hypothetical protein